MGLENPNYISELNLSNPTSDDPVSQGDDHIRALKKVLKQTFPGAVGTGYDQIIFTTEPELNNLQGLNEPIADYIGTQIELPNQIGSTQLTIDAVESINVNQQSLQEAGLIPTAWCVFDGRLSGTNSPTAGYNVTNITNLTVGQYQINFTTPMGNANYVVSGMVGIDDGPNTNGMVGIKKNVLPNVNNCTIKCGVPDDLSSTGTSPVSVHIVIFGGR